MATTTKRPDRRSDKEVVEEHLEMLEEMAEAGLPISDRCQRLVDKYESGDLDE